MPACRHFGYLRKIEVAILYFEEMLPFGRLDKEPQQPVVETHAKKKQMRLVERSGEMPDSVLLPIQTAQESENVVVPQRIVLP